MITVSIPVFKLIGGTAEEWALHGRALEQYFEQPVRQDPHGTKRFELALSEMHAAHAKIAEAAYKGADSMWAVI